MFRNYDWQCKSCGAVRESIIEFPQGDKPPRSELLHCGLCDCTVSHERLLSMPAKYLADRQFNPLVSGGTYDTTGHKEVPPLPDLAPGTENTGEAYADLFNSKEWQSAKRKQDAVIAENQVKRKRAECIKRGENISIRHDACPGDPNVTA